jgi:hypothetical protein
MPINRPLVDAPYWMFLYVWWMPVHLMGVGDWNFFNFYYVAKVVIIHKLIYPNFVIRKI